MDSQVGTLQCMAVLQHNTTVLYSEVRGCSLLVRVCWG
jgi:hypothetical protein